MVKFHVTKSPRMKLLCILDINPLKAGHTLVVPKKEIDYVFDLDDNQLAGLIIFQKRLLQQ